MKKLGKLSISPEKIMKNEDLINLQEGYEGGNHWVGCKNLEGELICAKIAFHTCDTSEVVEICRDLCPEAVTATCM